MTRARILLKASEGWPHQRIAEALGIGRATVERTRRRFIGENLAALDERPRPGNKPKPVHALKPTSSPKRASAAPKGRERWTLSLLAERVVQLKLAESYSTI